MRNQKGFSILEILIIMVIMAILAGGIFSAYNFIARETAWRHFVAKHESDAIVITNQITKDIESAGFGIGAEELVNTSLSTNLVSTTLPNGQVLNAIFSNYTVPGLAFREEKWSGCWGELRNGTLTVRSKNFLGKNCEFVNDWYVVLDPYTKKNICPQSSDYLCNDYSNMDGIIFYATSDNSYKYHQSFMLSYSITSSNLPKDCAAGTFNLAKSLGTPGFPGYQSNQPVLSCIFPGGFRIRAGVVSGNTLTYTDSVSIDDIQNKRLKLFRLCLITQVGYRQESISTQPQFSQACGEGPNIDSNWWNATPPATNYYGGKWYRWKIIEQDIPLRNYQ